MTTIYEAASSLLAPSKGLLVVDEYAEALIERTCGPGQPIHKYAEMMLRTPGLDSFVSGVLLTHATFAATASLRLELRTAGETRPLVGVRMDSDESRSTTGQTIREGLPTLGQRLNDLAMAGASFVEWRANLAPADVPRGVAHVEAGALALGAAAAQSMGLLPLLTVAMPDLGSQSIAVSRAVTTNALRALRDEFESLRVDPERLVLRVNMVLPGESYRRPAGPAEIARTTLAVLEDSVSTLIAGVVFLSGGQPLEQACTNLQAITAMARDRDLPWRLSFGYTRPLVAASVEAFGVHPHSDLEAQRELLRCCGRASQSVTSGPGLGQSG